MTIAKKKSKVDAKSMDETGRRSPGDERRKATQEVSVERRKVQRRRQIDPTTCERDYSDEELEFMRAMDDYKRRSGRMFPTCSEILEVIRDMGYVKPTSSNESAAVAASEPVLSEFSGLEPAEIESGLEAAAQLG